LVDNYARLRQGR